MKKMKMANTYFSFKQFSIYQDKAAFKVGTDGVLLGASASISGARRILDIGTGTGLIALMLAQRCDAEIIAIEPDYDSYIQCCENVTRSQWRGRITVEHTRLQNFQPAKRFDLVVSNPPFFTGSLKNPDPRKSDSRHNDTLSNDELLKAASRLITDDGRLEVIMPYTEGNILIADANMYGFYCNDILKIKPLPTSEIRRMILTFSKQRLIPGEKFLTIEHGRRHEFTAEYINLTKEFYLKF
jgi:tRNA1Val (adenine37-N6)-methyltransferase